MNFVSTKVGRIGIDVIESPDDGGWYAEIVGPDGSTAYTTAVVATKGEAGRAATAAIPAVVAQIREQQEVAA